MKVLVTGATGFLGRRIIDLLAVGDHEIHAVSRHSPRDDRVTWHELDLLDANERAKALAGIAPSHLIHLAWIADHGVFWHSAENDLWANATLDLFDRFAQSGGRRAVLVGSCAEYDWTDPDLATSACREHSTPLIPSSRYGRAKLDTFLRVSRFAESSGTSFAWARLFFLFGADENPDRLVPSVIRSVLQGKPASLHHPNRVLDFMETRDVAAALVDLLFSEVSGPVNVASGRGIQLSELAKKIEAIEDLDTAINGDNGDSLRLVADVTRLSTEVGFVPKYDLEASLRHVMAWWRSRPSEENTP